MTIPNYDELALTRYKAINDLLPTLSIKGQTKTISAFKTIHSGVVTYEKLPMIYVVSGVGIPVLRGTSLMSFTQDYDIELITAALQTDETNTGGSLAMQDANAAKYVLLNHYAQRPSLHISDTDTAPLAYLTAVVQILSISATAFSRDLQNPSPQYAGVRMTQRLTFGA